MQAIALDHDKYSAYLNHHLVAADAGVQAFKAAADTWAGTQWEAMFQQLHEELSDSHEKVKQLIENLGYEVSTVRNVVAGLAAAAGRLNPINLTRNKDGYMTQAEIDSLVGAVRAQQMMWETMLILTDIDNRLDKAQCQAMVDRCENQRARVLEMNRATAAERFTLQPED